MGIGGVSVLAGLGLWQLQRLEWKNTLIAELESRLAEPAIELTGDETPDDNFLPARAAGRFLQPDEAPQFRFLTSLAPYGPGFRLISVFELNSGSRILVDRGYIPQSVAPRSATPPAPPEGVVAVEGALHWPREVTDYTPEPNVAEKLVFARDVPALAALLATQPVMIVVAKSAARDGERWPAPLPPSVDLPNDHLGYAITWLAMAAIWLVMTLVFVFRGRLRR